MMKTVTPGLVSVDTDTQWQRGSNRVQCGLARRQLALKVRLCEWAQRKEKMGTHTHKHIHTCNELIQLFTKDER